MTKFLIKLFEAPEVNFRQMIEDLEWRSGRQSLDIRLTNQIQQEARVLLEYFALTDHTEKEIYYHLNAKIEQENAQLEALLGIQNTASPDVVVSTVLAYIEQKLPEHQGYFVKPTVLKAYLKKHAPKKTMKVLGYRSADSMLKRESLPLVINVLYELEGAEWHKAYEHFRENLLASDATAHAVCIKQVDPKAHDHLKKADIQMRYFIRESLELGQAVVIPMSKRFHCDTYAYIVAIIDSLARLQLHGAYYNYLRFQPDFGKRLNLVVRDGIHKGTQEYFDMMWPAYYKYISTNENYEEDFMNQPIVSVPDILAKHFMVKTPWQRFAGTVHGSDALVSMNVIDVVTNASNKLPYERRFVHHAQQEVWDRLNLAYMQHRHDIDF